MFTHRRQISMTYDYFRRKMASSLVFQSFFFFSPGAVRKQGNSFLFFSITVSLLIHPGQFWFRNNLTTANGWSKCRKVFALCALRLTVIVCSHKLFWHTTKYLCRSSYITDTWVIVDLDDQLFYFLFFVVVNLSFENQYGSGLQENLGLLIPELLSHGS